jgi:hypothetical protein
MLFASLHPQEPCLLHLSADGSYNHQLALL